jgi:ribose transport system substrate-binding protein
VNNRNKLVSIALILFALTSLIACGGRRHEADEYFVMVTSNKNIPYWQTAASGFYEAARQMNVKADVVGPDTYDPNGEKDEFHRILAKKPAGIIVSPADPAIMKPEIDAAIAQGIPVITIDTDAPDSNRLFFIGTNNYQAGTIGAKLAAKALNGKGSVVIFGMPNQFNIAERMRGYKDVLSEHPGIKIVREVDMKGDPRIVFDAVQAVLDKKEPIDGFISLEAQGGKEIATVLKNNKVTGKVVVAMDTDDAVLNGIKEGIINGTVAQKPYTMGYIGIKAVDDFFHNKMDLAKMKDSKSPLSPLPAYVDTGATLIDKSNVDEIQQALQASQTKK